MMERVDVREWVEFQWPYLMAFVGGARRVQTLAEQTGAFTRPRKIENAEVLLRLILMWAVAERSLIDTAAIAAEAGLADVSDAALVKRFAKAGDWLAALVSDLLINPEPSWPQATRVRVLDATHHPRRQAWNRSASAPGTRSWDSLVIRGGLWLGAREDHFRLSQKEK